MPKPDAPLVYQLRVTLQGVEPPIWRALQLPADATLGELERAVQAAMGWESYHLHVFTVRGRDYSDIDRFSDPDMGDEEDVSLRDAFPRRGSKIAYEYDLGDSWRHEIRLEERLPPDEGARYPNCVGGERACPPEDCGGIGGYRALLDAIENPADPENGDMIEWLEQMYDEDGFEPEAFSVDAVNAALRGTRA